MTTANAAQRRYIEHAFFAFIALLLIADLLIGFWRRYFSAGLVLAPLPSLLVHVHAVLFVGWVVLFSVQIGLIATTHVSGHRRLGAVMGWWAVAMVIIGPTTVVMGLRRRNAPQHKRLMTLATAAIIGPALARWPFDFIQKGPPVALVLIYLLPPTLLIAYDLATLHRVNRATWFGLGMMLLVLISFLVLPASQRWQNITNWIVNY